MKKFLIAGTFVVAMFAMVGCGSSSGGDASPVANEQAKKDAEAALAAKSAGTQKKLATGLAPEPDVAPPGVKTGTP